MTCTFLWAVLLALSTDASPQASKELVIGEACTSEADCAATANATCDPVLSVCVCPPTRPIGSSSGCLTASAVGGPCQLSEQCRPQATNSECSAGECRCQLRHYLHTYADGLITCLPSGKLIEEQNKVPVDPVMIGILASLILIFVIICAVLRLFSKARFRQNRTILNSANARLMNTSVFRAPIVAKPRSGDRRRSQVPSLTSAVPEDPPAPADTPADTPAAALQRCYTGGAGEERGRRGSVQTHGLSSNTTAVEVTQHTS